MRSKRALLPVLLSALFLGLPGCIASASSKSDYRGRYVSASTLARIKPGQTRSHVVALCGQPTRRQYIDETTSLWVWEYHKTTVRSGRLAVLKANRRTEENGQVFVEFKDDKVTKAWRHIR